MNPYTPVVGRVYWSLWSLYWRAHGHDYAGFYVRDSERIYWPIYNAAMREL